MKGPRLLALLLTLAIASGALLVFTKRSGRPAPESPEAETFRFVSRLLGRESKSMPPLRRVDDSRLAGAISRALTTQFGEDGLARRARAYALLHLMPQSQDLAGQWSTALASGARGFAPGPGEPILLADNFSLADPAGRARLARLMTQSLTDPPQASSDDAYLARWAVLGGVASEIESRFLAATGDSLPLPSQAEIEHEAFLLSLPLFSHNLVQLPLMQGRDAVRRRLAAGESLPGILASLPHHTLALLAPDASPGPPPELPPIPDLLLEESLGAYGTRLLAERLGDHLEAEALGPAWRADRYGLFKSDGREHLLWISHWADAETASRMARLLEAQITPDDPAGRFQRVQQNARSVIFANCADEFTLDEVLPHPVNLLPKSP